MQSSKRFLIPCLSLLLLGPPGQLAAQVSLSPAQLANLAAICQEGGVELAPSERRDKLLLVESAVLSGLHAALPPEIRAQGLEDAGVAVCLEETPVTLETCSFGALFKLPRVRRDLLLTAYSLETPTRGGPSVPVRAPEPPNCREAGVIDQTVTALRGNLPGIDEVLAALDILNLNTLDSDGDGHSNVREFALGTDTLDPGSPGVALSLTLNDSLDLTVMEGEPVNIDISLNPGIHRGESTRYYLYADTRAGYFSYQHPRRFVPSASRELSAAAPALLLRDHRLMALTGFGAGEYEMRFEVEIAGNTYSAGAVQLKVTPGDWHFTEVAASAGLDYQHGYVGEFNDTNRDQRNIAGGVAAGDYNRDGWVDLYVTRGSIGPNLLFKNMGDGSFRETGAGSGADLSEGEYGGALFGDYDGDGLPDLFVAGISDTRPVLLRNKGDGSFEDVTARAGLGGMRYTTGGSFGDYDRDGDLDLWVNHWTWRFEGGYLWRNNGDGSFTDVSAQAGIPNGRMADFTANFADIDNDGWPDILVAGDYLSSQVFRNNRNGTFTLATTEVISDENGMGAAVEDYDNDGDLDWFVSSIFDYAGPRSETRYVPWGASGNRFYENLGDGSFRDVTDSTGTRLGGWGWGSCFADLNNDGHLDLFQVNGYNSYGWDTLKPFDDDPSRLFISDGQGGFDERSREFGLDDRGQGRGIVCFDYDRDGDVDLFVANNGQAPALLRNDGGNRQHYLHVKVAGEGLNTEALGARVYVRSGGVTQMRELRGGSNYMSQNPAEAYFGLGHQQRVDELRVVWPSGREYRAAEVMGDRFLLITPP